MNLATTLDPDYVRLADHLHRGGAFAYYWAASEARDEKGFAKQKQTTWYSTAKRAYLPSDNGTYGKMHLYFGVHPTTTIPPTSSKGEARKPHQVRSQLTYIAAINCLFGEYDAKDFDGGKEEILGHIEYLALPPSIVIDSVGGYHAYWLLGDTFYIQGDADRARADAVQKAWVPFVGSDDDAKDLTRVLRIPGTRNYKAAYAPEFPKVAFVKADFDLLYTLDELEAALPEPIREYQPKAEKEFVRPLRDSLVDAAKWLDLLAQWRCEDYRPDDGAWVGVGMALSELGNAGLQLWEDWSRGSSKYKSGQCADKWKTFKPGAGITLGSLFYWAKQDSPDAFEPEYSERPTKARKEAAPAQRPVSEYDSPKTPATVARPLPHNIKAEEALLGQLLTDEDSFLDVQGVVAPEDFYQRKNEWIFEALSALHARGCGLDTITVADELAATERPVSEEDLFALVDSAPPTNNALHHARIVRQLGTVRRLVGAAKRIEGLAYAAVGGKVETALVESEAALLEVTQERAAGQGPKPLAELLPASEARLLAMSNTTEPVGVPAVPPSFSRLIGGWQPGKVYVVAAYPGDGKTSLALANGKAAADGGDDTLIFSGEMTADELIQKMIGSEGRINSQILHAGPVDGATFQQAQRAIRSMEKKTHLWIDDTSGLTWVDMAARAKRVNMALQRRGRKLKLVIVDYLQYMQHIYRKGSNDAAAIAGTMIGLKSIAKELGVAVIVASQLNRDGAKGGEQPRKPRLQDLRESGGIEQEGDAVIFIYYPDKEGCPDNPDLILAKMRGGPAGVRTVHFNKAHNIWQDVGRQEEPQGYHNGNGRHYGDYEEAVF